jgi:hypothetical protein
MYSKQVGYLLKKLAVKTGTMDKNTSNEVLSNRQKNIAFRWKFVFLCICWQKNAKHASIYKLGVMLPATVQISMTDN